MNLNSLSYELGVFMFQSVSGHEEATKVTTDYDIEDNFTQLYLSVGTESINSKKLKEGFINESFNYGVDEKESIELFNKTKEYLNSR